MDNDINLNENKRKSHKMPWKMMIAVYLLLLLGAVIFMIIDSYVLDWEIGTKAFFIVLLLPVIILSMWSGIRLIIEGRNLSQKISRCSETITASVKKIDVFSDKEDGNRYHMTVEFTINGNTYTEQGQISSSQKNLTQMPVIYNPDNPEEYFVKGLTESPKTKFIFGIGLTILGLFILAFIILTFVS